MKSVSRSFISRGISVSIKRQDILDHIVLALQAILTTGGYHTNLGSNVFLFRTSALNENELPAAVVRDVDQKKLAEYAGNPGLIDWLMTVEIELFCMGAQGSDVLARQMMADVNKAVGIDMKFGGYAEYTTPVSDELKVEQGLKEKIVGGAFMRFQIVYRTVKWGEN